MNVSFRLRRTGELASVTGLLLLTDDVRELMGLCARLAGPFPNLFSVPGGFLLKLHQPLTGSAPGTLRLQEMRDDLYLPAGAELLPTLFDDEAAALVRDGGRIFLPGGRVLGYDSKRPLRLADLLAPPRVERPAWRALPEGPVLADQLREIRLERPEVSAEVMLDSGGPGEATEDDEDLRPPGAAGPISWIVGHAGAGLGRGLFWLGKLFRWRGLASLGAGLVKSALARVPRLSESLLGQQEAALRELLRRFREGKLDAALRRALPMGGEGDRGGTAASDARLPTHRLAYSLSDLLGGGTGTASIWFGGGDVQALLAEEYLKAARDATARGDYRRAAFIYGKLLHDFRMAADVLFRGGLYRDAAVLYHQKLNDLESAARCFEAAGELDRALKLYRLVGNHIAAGDLLRRVGEIDAALAEYRLAAEQMIEKQNYAEAGDLMLSRAGRRDLALAYLRAGWEERPFACAWPCLHRLAELYAKEPTPAPLLELIEKADTHLRQCPDDKAAAPFYDLLVRLAANDNLAGEREQLRDRGRLGLAGLLHRRAEWDARPGPAVSELFGRSGLWSADVVTDADEAYRAVVKGRPAPARAPRVSHIVLPVSGRVTAACAARDTGAVFVGFSNGSVVCFEPERRDVTTLPLIDSPQFGSVKYLAVDAVGDMLAVVRCRDNGTGSPDASLSGIVRQPDGTWHEERSKALHHLLGLTALTTQDGEILGGWWDDERLTLWFGTRMLPFVDVFIRQALQEDLPFGAVLLPTAVGVHQFQILLLTDEAVSLLDMAGTVLAREPLSPTIRGAPASLPCLDMRLWNTADGKRLEMTLAGHGDGTLYWFRVEIGTDTLKLTGRGARAGSYRAAALLGPGRVAAVSDKSVHWLTPAVQRPEFQRSSPLDRSSAVACFSSPRTGELFIVCEEGDLLGVPVPHEV